MSQMAVSLRAKPIWRMVGPANARGIMLVVPASIEWADATTDLVADHKCAMLLPDNTPGMDSTVSDYVVCCYQRPGARPLYAVRLKDYGAGSTDSILSAAVGSVNWAPIRFSSRTLSEDFEQF